MSLVQRLKRVFCWSGACVGAVMVPVTLSKTLILFIGLLSAPALAGARSARCDADTMNSLPGQPVALQRVESSEGGRIRVSWALRTGLEESEESDAPHTLQTGAEFDILRCLPPGRWMALGHGEVVARNGSLVEGMLNVAGQSVSVDRGMNVDLVSTGNLYPNPMVGDLVVVRRKEIAQVKKISPRVKVPVASLFETGGADSAQAELTRSGQESLRQLIAHHFGDAHGKLLIEVHAQRVGSRQKLRQETKQKADSIERFLRYEFGIAKEQLLAIGHGSDGYVPGFVPAGFEPDYVVMSMLSGDGATR